MTPRPRQSGKPAPAGDAAVARKLQELEESLLLPHVRKSARLVECLADDFVEFASNGKVYTRADLVALLQAEDRVTQTTSDFRVALLAPDVALITYRITRHADPPVHTLRCSIWRRRGRAWRMVFHQATLTVPPGPSAPGGSG